MTQRTCLADFWRMGFAKVVRAVVLCGLLVLSAVTVVGADRWAVPTPAELKTAQAEIKDLFKQELTTAKSSAQLTEVAEKILSNVQNDEASRVTDYALLTQAQGTAIKASNIRLTRRIVRQMAEKFELDEHQLATQALKELAKGQVDGAYHRELAEVALQLVKEAQATDRLDVVASYLDTVNAVATKLK